MTLAEAATAVAAGTHQAFRGQAGYEPGFRMYYANEFPFTPAQSEAPAPPAQDPPAQDPPAQDPPAPSTSKAKKTPNK